MIIPIFRQTGLIVASKIEPLFMKDVPHVNMIQMKNFCFSFLTLTLVNVAGAQNYIQTAVNPSALTASNTNVERQSMLEPVFNQSQNRNNLININPVQSVSNDYELNNVYVSLSNNSVNRPDIPEETNVEPEQMVLNEDQQIQNKSFEYNQFELNEIENQVNLQSVNKEMVRVSKEKAIIENNRNEADVLLSFNKTDRNPGKSSVVSSESSGSKHHNADYTSNHPLKWWQFKRSPRKRKSHYGCTY